jgi:hypothetical protein
MAAVAWQVRGRLWPSAWSDFVCFLLDCYPAPTTKFTTSFYAESSITATFTSVLESTTSQRSQLPVRDGSRHRPHHHLPRAAALLLPLRERWTASPDTRRPGEVTLVSLPLSQRPARWLATTLATTLTRTVMQNLQVARQPHPRPTAPSTTGGRPPPSSQTDSTDGTELTTAWRGILGESCTPITPSTMTDNDASPTLTRTVMQTLRTADHHRTVNIVGSCCSRQRVVSSIFHCQEQGDLC